MQKFNCIRNERHVITFFMANPITQDEADKNPSLLRHSEYLSHVRNRMGSKDLEMHRNNLLDAFRAFRDHAAACDDVMSADFCNRVADALDDALHILGE